MKNKVNKLIRKPEHRKRLFSTDYAIKYKHTNMWSNPVTNAYGEYYHVFMSVFGFAGKTVRVWNKYQAAFVRRYFGIPKHIRRQNHD